MEEGDVTGADTFEGKLGAEEVTIEELRIERLEGDLSKKKERKERRWERWGRRKEEKGKRKERGK